MVYSPHIQRAPRWGQYEKNPFTPAFGGKPQHFFGRVAELSLIEDALDNELSPYRALFITGNRGCGKTALLEQASERAADRRWASIDVHAEDALMAVVRKLAGGTGRTETKMLQPGAFGVTLGGMSTALATQYAGVDLADLIQDKLNGPCPPKGVLITVDEAQKMSESDAEGLCTGVQMAMRKGAAVMLILAGLPESKEKIASYNGCTFMERAFDVKLSSLLIDETYRAFRGLLGAGRSLFADDEAVDRMARFSLGYPYLMQLIGYHAVESAAENEPTHDGITRVTLGDVRVAEGIAYTTYRDNVLKAALRPVRNGTREYLRAMASCLDDDGRAATGSIARELGKEATQCSTTRQRLLDRRLIVADGVGYVRFNLPYLSRCLCEEEIDEESSGRVPGAWLF